jgi:multidrug resistance protein, MATE family
MSLTKFPEGSLRELWYVTFPLMLSFLSVALMSFTDRLFLARYSAEAFTAITDALTVGWTFVLGWIILANISEVFVAQHNGAKNYKKLGKSVWQTIWLSLSSIIFFFPLAFFSDQLFFTSPTQHLERDYLRLIFYFGPVFPLYYALYSFFIGQGKTRLLTVLIIATNFLNIEFDYCLIFGIPGWIEPLGLNGSAIATGCSSLFQVIVLTIIFLNTSNRHQYGTNHWQIDLKFLRKYLRIGLPSAIFAVIEMLAWVAYYLMITKLGERHLTIASILQSLFILFCFFIEEISKGVSTVVGNLIGAEQNSIVPQVIKIGACLHLVFSSLLFIFAYLFIDEILKYFLPHASLSEIANIKPSLFYCLMVYSFFLFFEGIRLTFARVLTVAGDTFFLLIGGSLSTWLLLVWPIYQLVYLNKGTIEQAVTLVLVYSVLTGSVYFYRFYQGYWRSLSLIEKQAVQSP